MAEEFNAEQERRAVEKLVQLEDSKHNVAQAILDLDHEINEASNRRNLLTAKLDTICLEQSDLVPKDKLLKTTLGSFSWKKTAACNVFDESLLAATYLKDVPATTKVDKAKIKKDIEGGTEVPGAEVNTNYTFQIKLKK